ncbi:MAG TPA: cupredoxin domain-containing protein, partial [Thermoanaerobaculia bacterium]|nr:cupredoxin domain-containing protein [Thermoanaerobaculia bacterium]
FVWTADRVAAVVTGLALIVFLYVFFFGKRRVVARPVPAGPQEVTVAVAGGYKPDVIVARKGMPLKLVFDRRESNPCSDEVVIPEFEIRQALPAHQKTTIEITTQREGDFPFSCGMNMLHGKIKVVP